MKKLFSYLCALSLLLGCFGGTVSAAENVKDDFAKVRENFLESLLDQEYAETSEETKKLYNERVAGAVKKAQEYSASMNKAAARDALWEDASDLGTNLSRLTVMAKAYAYNGSPLKGNAALLNDIVSGCEYVYQFQYNETIEKTGNWWNWEIGWSKSQVALIALIHDGLSATQVERYLRGVRRFCPNPYKEKGTGTSAGANRVDICYAILVESALKEEEDRLKEACKAAMEVLKYVDKSDGFYDDGSFIQHGNIAYNYSYGEVMMQGITQIMGFVKGTRFQVTDDPLMENMYEIVYQSFEPLMYKGGGMDMVRGRAISRDYDGHQNGHTVLTGILRLCEFAPEPHLSRLKSIFKYQVSNDTYRNYMSTTNLNNRVQAQMILDDPNVVPMETPDKNKIYNRMDRVTNFRPGWAVGLAMASKRIAWYEGSNNENAKGWYQGNGTLYLYNDDLAQFNVGYWVTVDPYRYPGTTVDRQPRSNFSGTGANTGQTWVGSTGLDDRYSVSGMQAAGFNSTLRAKKSWFMFDDEIVCLGADINSTDNIDVETTVENRKLTEVGDNAVTINGQEMLQDFDQETTVDNVSWAHLEGNVEGSDIGYYFPEPTTMNAIRETRRNNLQDINPTRTNRDYTNNFFTFWIPHGVNPKKETYAYTLLPGKSAQETQAYAENSGITILENSPQAQAVKDEKLQITGINFWENKDKTVDGVTCNTAAAVMLKRTDKELEISVCDPTQEQTDAVELTLPGEGYSILSIDDGMTVKQENGNVLVSTEVGGAKGKNFKVKLVKTSDIPADEVISARIGSSIVLLEGSANAMVNGEKQVIDSADPSVAPCMQDNRVYVPLRFLGESLGATVTWDDGTQTATLDYTGTQLIVDTAAGTISVGGQVTEGQVLMRGDRILVPVRLVCEAVGKKVYWHSKGLIIIGSNEKVFNAATEVNLIDELIGQILR